EIKKSIKKLPVEILKGIVAGDYKKPGWNEYVPSDGFTLADLPLITYNKHPRMITESQVLSAKKNINRPPYLNWYNWLIREASKDNIYPNSPMYKLADRLKILAFLYRVDDNPQYLIRINKLLKFVPEPHTRLTLQGGKRGVGWGDFLESAQALTALCVAMDLVYHNIDEVLRKDTIRKMLQITQQLLSAMKNTPANNHVIVIAIAIMEMAMLEDRPDEYIAYNQQQLWNKGLWHLSRGLGRIAPDGGYAESVYYARFVLSYLAALSVHLENMTGIRLFDHIYLERLVNWVITNDKGSGYFSAFDDELQPEYFIFPIIIPGSIQADYWHTYWKTYSDYQKVHANMVEGLCVYQEIVTSNYSFPDEVQFFPDLGQAVFRDKTIEPNIFASFLAERERWFADRHEHIDPLSFEISAYGEDIIVEAGYGFGISEFYRSTWYTSPYAHNGILIDGVGTYRNPIWGDSIGSGIHHAFKTERNASATLRHQIQDVEINRKVYFINSRFFLMIDQIRGNRLHSFALYFNHK
ncbi:MAG: heparinase II/III family protein, partial [Calditrichia bacterium]